jgi:hypothetical protein
MKQLNLFPSTIISLCGLSTEEREAIVRDRARGWATRPTLDSELARWAWRRERGLPTY